MNKTIFDLVNENADEKSKPKQIKRDYSRLLTIATYGILGVMIIQVIMYSIALFLVTRI